MDHKTALDIVLDELTKAIYNLKLTIKENDYHPRWTLRPAKIEKLKARVAQMEQAKQILEI